MCSLPERLWFFYVVAVFLALGLLAPRVLQPVPVVWLKFAIAVNWIMTHLLLTVAFLGIITSTRVILRLRGKDPLNRAWTPKAPTYWAKPDEQPTEFQRYFNWFYGNLQESTDMSTDEVKAEGEAQHEETHGTPVPPDAKPMSIVGEFWAFLRVRKKFWLLPIILALLLLAVLMVVGSQAGVVSPFVYML